MFDKSKDQVIAGYLQELSKEQLAELLYNANKFIRDVIKCNLIEIYSK